MRLLWLPDLLGTPLPLRLGFCHDRSLGIERRCVNGVQNTGAARSVDAAAKKPRPIWEKSFGPEHPNIAAGLNNLALLLQTMNRLAEAEPMIRRALVRVSLSEGQPENSAL